jgi:hypothetical protein
MENRFYTYCYLDPRRPGNYFYEGFDFCFLYEPFYIGRGCDDRYTEHLREVINNNTKITNRIKSGKIKNILNENMLPFIIKLDINISKMESIEKEIDYIRLIGRLDLKTGPLSNLTSGGEGGMLDMSPELRKYYSKLFSGEGNPMFGVSRYGDKNPFFNKKHSLESIQKISNSKKGCTSWNTGIKYKTNKNTSKRIKDYKIISPDNTIFIIRSIDMNIFCSEKSISSRCLIRYMNKGKIPPYKQGKDLPDRINSTNWEIIRL